MIGQLDLITIGEAYVELLSDKTFENTEYFNKNYGGDAVTTAVTGSRMGINTGFITCLGNDYFKNFLLKSWQSEHLDTEYVKQTEGQNAVALMSISSNDLKETAFYRKKTAAQKLSIDDIDENYIKSSKYIYTTGITQSLSISANEAIKKAYEIARKNNTITAYTLNYKNNIMLRETAKENFEDIITLVDILFLNAKNDIPVIMDTDSIENVIKRAWDTGVKIVVVQSAQNGGYYTGYNGDIVFCKYFTNNVVDTTGSKDVFNGAFLASMIQGAVPFEAAKIASVASGLQTQNIGTIKSIPTREDILSNLSGAVL